MTDLASIEEIENLWIPARDGARLAGRVWLPKGARVEPVPALLEYIPYRKRDFMRERDEPMHRYFALSGYASVRVDLRGSGDSDGVLDDEYSPVELDDALAILEWIAAQPWCTGDVGMTGISWGGFNALQVAALAPPQLKAIITLCASDDRYGDDAHYKGGCLLNENLQWGSILTLYNALPPDPAIVGARWWDHWLKGRDDGVMDGPMLRAWIQDSAPPRPHHETRPGRWVGEAVWPSDRIRPRRYRLDRGYLSTGPGASHEISFSSAQSLGVRGGEWCGATSARTTAAPWCSTAIRSTRRSTFWARRSSRSTSWRTDRWRSSSRGSATWRRTASRRASPMAS